MNSEEKKPVATTKESRAAARAAARAEAVIAVAGKDVMIRGVQYKYFEGAEVGPFYETYFETEEQREDARNDLAPWLSAERGWAATMFPPNTYFLYPGEGGGNHMPRGNGPKKEGGYPLGITEKAT